MRLFIAIGLPKSLIEELTRLQNELGRDGLRPVRDFHLTLKFLGEIPETKLPIIKSSLSGIKFDSSEAELSQPGVFPDQEPIRVIWVGVRDDKVISLQKEIDSSLEKSGFRKEKDFTLHITLARVNFIRDKEEFRKKLDSLKTTPIKFPISEFSLIKSTLTKQGPIYETLTRFGAKL